MLFSSLLFFAGSTVGVTVYKRIRQSQKTSNTKAILETEPQQIATKLSKPDDPQVEKELQANQEINHYLTVSTTSLVLTTLGALVYSPLTLVSIPLLIYASGYIFSRAYEARIIWLRVKLII